MILWMFGSSMVKHPNAPRLILCVVSMIKHMVASSKSIFMLLVKFVSIWFINNPLKTVIWWAENGILDLVRRVFTLCKCNGNSERRTVSCSERMDNSRSNWTQKKYPQRADYRTHTCLSIPETSPYTVQYCYNNCEVIHWISWKARLKSLCPFVCIV